MAKETWKAGNMLYPLPAVMVSVSDGEGNDNIITNGSGIAVADGQCMIIVEQGKAREVIEHPKEERTKQFLSRYTQG